MTSAWAVTFRSLTWASRFRPRNQFNGAAVNPSGGPAAGVFKSVHFSVEEDAPLLDAPVVPAAYYTPVLYQDGTYWYTALSKSLEGLLHRLSHELSMVCHYTPYTAGGHSLSRTLRKASTTLGLNCVPLFFINSSIAAALPREFL